MTMTPAVRPLLEMRKISKSFFGVKVLDEVSIDLLPGEVLALVGENGAGKSTLIKILNGDYQKDGGEIAIDGEVVQVGQPRDAEALGIRMIYQELHYAPDLSVTENVLLGHLPGRAGPLGKLLVDWPRAHRSAREFLRLLEVDIDPAALMGSLAVVEREIVEIVKALSTQARIVVMDEPTAALTPHEVALLFKIIENLRSRGVALIYISHRLDEIFQIAQRVAVLRNGRRVATRDTRGLTYQDVVRLMVGREVEQERGRSAPLVTAPGLELRGLSRAGAFEDINLSVRAGEIVGIFGLLGAGHMPLTRTIFGAEKAERGEICVAGKAALIDGPRAAVRAGVGMVPVDRKMQGLVLGMPVRGNVTLSSWPRVSRFGFFSRRAEREHVETWIERLRIRMAGGMEVEVRYLSGGNQQKVVLSRWLEANVKVLVLNEPTWGVDVGARADIYELLETLADQGLAILIVSSDTQEVLAVSDRILTMYKGQITAEFRRAEANQANLLQAAAGGKA
jgi:ABC-type sugar transport system ATPase subunit